MNNKYHKIQTVWLRDPEDHYKGGNVELFGTEHDTITLPSVADCKHFFELG